MFITIRIRMRTFFREHQMIFVFGFVVAALMIMPIVIFPIITPATYGGINISNHGVDELWYLSRARDVVDGHSLGNVMMQDGKNGLDPYATFVEVVLMAPVRWLGALRWVSVPTIYAVLNFFGVWLLTILIYFFVLFIAREKKVAILSAVFVIAGYKILDIASPFSTNLFSRAFSPYIPLIATFLYLNVLIRSFRRSTSWLLVAGIIFGFIFYIYFYAWSFLLVFNGILGLLCLIHKDYNIFKKIFIITIVALLLGCYNLSRLFITLPPETAHQLFFFHWVQYTRTPYLNLMGLITMILLIVATIFKKSDEHFIFFWAWVISGWAVMNQQIMTGQQLESGHWRQYFILPFAIIIVAYLIWKFIYNARTRNILCYCGVALSLIVCAIGQFRSTFTRLSDKQDWQRYRPILDYLSQEQNTGVILAPDDLTVYLYTIYTPHDVFWARGFLLVNLPEQHIKDALFIYSYLNKNIKHNFSGYYRDIMANPGSKAFYREPDWFYAGIYQTLEGYWSGMDFYQYNRMLVDKDPSIVDKRPDLIGKLAKEYNDRIPDDISLSLLLANYNVQYLVWDRLSHPEWDISIIKGLNPVLNANGIVLYRFTPPNK